MKTSRAVTYVMKKPMRLSGGGKLIQGRPVADLSLRGDLPDGCDFNWLEQAKRSGHIAIESPEPEAPEDQGPASDGPKPSKALRRKKSKGASAKE